MLTTNYSLRLPTLLLTAIVMAASVLLLFLVVGPHPTARADTTFTVKSSADTDGTTCGAEDCSLRQAINAANAASGKDTIVFDVGQSETITLGSTLPTISDAAGLTIDGGSASITVSGNKQVRVFRVDSGAKLALKNLTIADGLGIEATETSGGGVLNAGTLEVADSTFSANQARSGGGIFNSGTLEVVDSTFSANRADDNNSGSADSGGGIFNQAFSITATVSGSTFSENSATGGGGGIVNIDRALLEVSNSTFSENSASQGGGIHNRMLSTLTLSNSTFSGNSATGGGGGIANSSGIVTFKNTLLANSPSGGNCTNSGLLTNGGYNIDDGTSCGFSTNNHSKSSTNPLLDPEGLQDNGGPTQTIALQADSPAMDQGKAFGATTDQRGVGRPQDEPAIENATDGDGSDIGAFEVDKIAPTLTSIDDGDSDNQVSRGEVLSYTLTFSEDIDESTLTADGLDNAGTASISIGSIAESSTTPGVFTVEVTPTSLGTLVLRIKEGAQVEDVAGNKLEAPVEDDTTLTVINSPPEATRDTYTIADGERGLTVPLPGVLANDTDAQGGDTLTVSLLRGPLVGTLKLGEDGSFVYRMPKRTYLRNEFSGVTFVYEVSDGNGGTDRAKVTINKG